VVVMLFFFLVNFFFFPLGVRRGFKIFIFRLVFSVVDVFFFYLIHILVACVLGVCSVVPLRFYDLME